MKTIFSKRTKSMVAVDFRRMFTTPLYYIMVGISLVMPILILVMTTMMDGTVSTNPQTNQETVIEGFDNVWQIIGSAGGDATASAGMSLTSMCNINMLYFMVAILVCIFVADDFRSGYAKNLFTVRSKKSDYAVSKILTGCVGGASMIIAFFIGSMVGGAIAGLTFALGTVSVFNVIMCVLAKILLVAVFVSIFVFASVVAKQKLWLSIILSLGIGMLLFTMVPMITPLNASFMNVILCLVGGVGFSVLFGYLSNLILNKQDIL